MSSQPTRGFTLIELVVVITILGILAAFAVPRFITLDSTARVATMNGLAGSVRSAAALARGMSMTVGGSPSAIQMEGSAVNMLNNYPDASLAGIGAALNSSGTGDFTFSTTGASGIATWTKVGAPAAAVTAATCSVTYAAATLVGGVLTAPQIAASTSGC